MWRGDERFLKDPKNDGNGGGEGGIGTVNRMGPVLISRRSASQTVGM